MKGVGHAQQFLFGAFVSDARFVHGAVFIVFVNSNDGSGGDTSIDVGGSVQRIENGNVLVSFGKEGVLVGVDKIKL